MDAPLPAGRSYARTDVAGRDSAASLINELDQPADQSQAWGTTRTLFWSIISFGLIPAIWWPIKFRQHVASERKLIARLSDWMRAHSYHSESALLRNSEEKIRSAPILAIIPLLICGGLVYFVSTLPNAPHQLTDLLRMTYWHRQWKGHGGLLDEFFYDIHRRQLTLFTAWNVALAAAYLCHGIQLKVHRATMSLYLGRVNRVLAAEGLNPVVVKMPRPSTGLFWLLAIGCLWYMSAAWGIFAMLAGAGQYRYLSQTAPAIRAGLAKSVAEISLRAASPVALASRCPRERCRAVVRPGAHFCGRCGSVLEA